MGRSFNVDIPHLKRDHPQSKNVRFARGETRCFFDAEKFGGHPSVGSLESRRGSLRAVETGDAGEPKVTKTRTARLINENIILRWSCYHGSRYSGERS